MRWRRGTRGWAILWAVLQFALPVAANYGDAWLERATPYGVSGHAESRTSESCTPVHPADCALCHVVSRVGTPSTVQADLASTLCPKMPIAATDLVVVGSSRDRTALPRAPPVS